LRLTFEKNDEDMDEDAKEKKRDKIGRFQADFVGQLHIIALRASAVKLGKEAQKVKDLRDEVALTEIVSENDLKRITAKYKEVVPNADAMRNYVKTLKLGQRS
jgi:hypothetical protein